MAKDLANGVRSVLTGKSNILLVCLFVYLFIFVLSFFLSFRSQASSVWKEYKDQKHNLFFTEATISGYLTGPTGVAGYLTAGTSSANSAPLTAPPPSEDTQLENGDQ